MICYEFKGGTGTASRRVGLTDRDSYTVGALVQANHGGNLRIAGIPVYTEIRPDPQPAAPAPRPGADEEEMGSIIIVVATDAPLMPHQLKRIAHRTTHGLGRTGATSGNGSGDIAIAFSTANAGAATAPESGSGPVARPSMIAAYEAR